MYDDESQLLIEKPINRYLINSPMLPKTEAPFVLPPGEGAWQPPGIVDGN